MLIIKGKKLQISNINLCETWWLIYNALPQRLKGTNLPAGRRGNH